MARASRYSSLLAVLASPAFAQEIAPPINWAFAAYFGTGHYRFDDGASAYVLTARPELAAAPARLDEGGRSIGIELRFPVAIGAHDWDLRDLGSTLQFDNVNTLSFVPGAEIEIPVSARWSLKPFGHLGVGAQMSGDASAWIYWFGVKSRLRFPGSRFDWSLVNALTFVGYATDDERSSVRQLLTAAEFEHPLKVKVAGEPVRLHWHIGYTSYLNEIELRPRRLLFDPVTIDDEWEVGAAFSTGDEALRLWRFKWDRVGMAYRFSSDGEFEGVRAFRSARCSIASALG